MTGRRLALLLLAAGLILGAIADRVPDLPTPLRQGRFLIAADLHVHSFLGDGAIGPWNLGREAHRRGLHAIAITNHNQVFASRLGHWLSQHLGGALILTGEEVTNPGHHVIALGIQRLVDWHGPPAQIVDAIHAQGGVAIAAHPERAYWRSFDPESRRKLDGAERLHPLVFHRPAGRAQLATFAAEANRLCDRPLAAIGSSDFHTMAPLGECRTFMRVAQVSEAGILDAIRAGDTSAFCDGDPVPDGATVPPRATLGLGGVLGWLGLLGLLLLRRRG